VKTSKPWLLSLTFVVSAISAVGCGHAHLSSQYAQAYTSWFDAQHVKSKAAGTEASRSIIESLDAGEAAAVSKTYRRARGDDTGVSRLLTIGAPRGGGGGEAYMPPASVP
jgi:hypothetical protein